MPNITTDLAAKLLDLFPRLFPNESAAQAMIELQTLMKGTSMALSLGGVTPAEIEAGLKAVQQLVELVEKLPFISSSGTFKTVLDDIDTALKYAEEVANDI